MSKRTIPWGTVVAGALALGVAVLVALTEMAGVSIPLAGAGPGAVIVVGLLIIAGAGPKVGGAGLVLRGPHPSPILACPRSAVPSGPHTIAVAGCAAGT